MKTDVPYRKLADKFRKGGFDYELVERVGNAAIYRQTKGHSVHFEVGRIRFNQAREQFGVKLEASESWPSSEEWGVKGFSYFTLDEAKVRLAKMVKL